MVLVLSLPPASLFLSLPLSSLPPLRKPPSGQSLTRRGTGALAYVRTVGCKSTEKHLRVSRNKSGPQTRATGELLNLHERTVQFRNDLCTQVLRVEQREKVIA